MRLSEPEATALACVGEALCAAYAGGHVDDNVAVALRCLLPGLRYLSLSTLWEGERVGTLLASVQNMALAGPAVVTCYPARETAGGRAILSGRPQISYSPFLEQSDLQQLVAAWDCGSFFCVPFHTDREGVNGALLCGLHNGRIISLRDIVLQRGLAAACAQHFAPAAAELLEGLAPQMPLVEARLADVPATAAQPAAAPEGCGTEGVAGSFSDAASADDEVVALEAALHAALRAAPLVAATAAVAGRAHEPMPAPAARPRTPSLDEPAADAVAAHSSDAELAAASSTDSAGCTLEGDACAAAAAAAEPPKAEAASSAGDAARAASSSLVWSSDEEMDASCSKRMGRYGGEEASCSAGAGVDDDGWLSAPSKPRRAAQPLPPQSASLRWPQALESKFVRWRTNHLLQDNRHLLCVLCYVLSKALLSNASIGLAGHVAFTVLLLLLIVPQLCAWLCRGWYSRHAEALIMSQHVTKFCLDKLLLLQLAVCAAQCGAGAHCMLVGWHASGAASLMLAPLFLQSARWHMMLPLNAVLALLHSAVPYALPHVVPRALAGEVRPNSWPLVAGACVGALSLLYVREQHQRRAFLRHAHAE